MRGVHVSQFSLISFAAIKLNIVGYLSANLIFTNLYSFFIFKDVRMIFKFTNDLITTFITTVVTIISLNV